jgi:hypothetical protein
LGVCDDGTVYEKFTQEEIDYSLDIIKMMADGCNSYIENIKINRINNILWLNITIRRKNEYMNEYRINFKANNLKKLIKKEGYEYKTSRDIYFNTIIYNNEKYLFFECNNNNFNTNIDFNLTVTDNFNNLFELLSFVEKNMVGNNNTDSDEVIFNIIKCNYIQSVGYIMSGFLKSGRLNKGMMLISNKYNLTCQIISIHNNYIDCNDAIGPSTISINIIIINKFNGEINKIDGVLYKQSKIKMSHDQNELEFPSSLDLQQRRLDRRALQLSRKAERRELQSRARMEQELQ